jgi:hypothetical protein
MPSQSEQDLSNFQTLVSVATERPRLTIEQQKNILNQNNSNVNSFFYFFAFFSSKINRLE